jgi:heavy metal translocating P-type ATPase
MSPAIAQEATAEPSTVELTVRGMTCAACAARVEKRLNAIDQVTATVNLVTEKATVTMPPTMRIDDLVLAIQDAGYDARPASRPAADAPARAGGARAAEELRADTDTASYLRRRLIVAAIFFVPLSDLSVLLSLVPGDRFPGWQWVLIAVAAPVVLYSAWPFHRAALRHARHGAATMDTLVSLGIITACGWSVYAMFVLDRGRTTVSLYYELFHASGGGVYLEVAASVTTFLLAGRFYEARARRSAGEAMRELAQAGASDVCVVRDDGTQERIPVSDLRPGARFVVRPGERAAADGTVLFGQSAIDRSMMTGESVPTEIGLGDIVTAGSIVVSGRLIMRADRVGDDTQLAHLIAMVDQAQAGKAAIQRVADRISAVFVPTVLTLSALTLAGWLLAGTPVERAFSAALAVLIIACPCALGLATPAALMVASGRGAQLGIFIKGYRALESSRSADTVLLDKTGTITTGEMRVTAVEPLSGVSRADLLRRAGGVEQASQHPIAAAISSLAAAELGSLPDAPDFEALAGLGARGTVAGQEVIVGGSPLMAQRGHDVPEGLAGWLAGRERDGETAVLVSWGGQVRGGICVADTIKPSAAGAVAELGRLGLHTMLVSGDAMATAAAIAKRAGISDVVAQALPQEKIAVIARLRANGRSVAMVGDGVNDGPALATADLGIAMGTGTDVAISAADMILMRDDLLAVPEAIRLARATMRTIRQNLGWAFGYNIAAIPLAAAGLCNPLIAGAAMALSSVFVVTNSARLRHFGASPAQRTWWRPVPAAPPRPSRPSRIAASQPEEQEQVTSCPG